MLSKWQIANKYPGRFDTEVLQDMPPHGYIIVFGGSHSTKKCHIVCAVGRGAEGGGGYLPNKPESPAATYSSKSRVLQCSPASGSSKCLGGID